MRPSLAFRPAWLFALASPVLLATAAQPREDPSEICRRAASGAASRTGVPYDVLLAISIVETGSNGQPWPWTIGEAGDGHRFDSSEAAEAHVAAVLETGDTNVDLGCFQINYRWHAQAFSSISDMLNPDRNASYAAELLAGHFGQSGDWAAAAAAYHSATPEFAEAYRSRFESVYAGLGGWSDNPDPVNTERANRFPLLVAGALGRNGSLVPDTAGGVPLIGGP